MQDDIFIDEQGRFQMLSLELAAFIRFLRENHVPCSELETNAFTAGGQPYGYGRLHHPYEVEVAEDLFRHWRNLQVQG